MKSKDMNWKTVPLGTLADFRNGINYTKKNFGKGIKVINVRNFQDYSYATFDDLDEVNLIKVIKEEDLLKNNDIIFVRSNGNRQLIGRSLFVSDIKEKVVHSAFTIKVRFNSDKVIPRFYAYLFRTSLIRQTLSAHGNGTNISNLNQQILSNLPVPLPTLSTQNKIVNIISAYDDLIENNTRRIKILESMAQTLYQEWFVKFRFPGHEQVKMVESELGLIPEGWECKTIKDVCEKVNYGYTASATKEDTGTKFLRITDIVPFIINWDSVPFCEISEKNKDKYDLLEGDVVIARTGATTGYAKRINKRHPKSVFASYLVRIRTNKNISSQYIGVIVESEKYKAFIKSNLSGAAQPQANAKILTSFPIVIPPKGIQSDFDNIVSNLLDQKELLQLKNLTLRKTRDLLLPKLISGQIDVENLDINAGGIAA